MFKPMVSRLYQQLGPWFLLLRCLTTASLLGLVTSVLAQELLPVPALASRVQDTSGTLNDAQLAALSTKLQALETASGAQVVVLVVPSTAPEDIAAYAHRVADTWKVGRKGVGDGLLLLVAKDDRKLRIEVSRALEGAVPDLAAKRIISDTIAPHFKQGEFAQGIEAGLDALALLIKAEALPAPAELQPTGSLAVGDAIDEWLGVQLLFAVPVALFFMAVRGLKGLVAAALVMPFVGFFLSMFFWMAIGADDGVLVGLILSLPISIAVLGRMFSPAQPSTAVGRNTAAAAGSVATDLDASDNWRSSSDESDSVDSSDSSSGFSSGDGGSFGGGGASGEW